MRLVTYDRRGTAQPGVLRDGDVIDLPATTSILDLIRQGADGMAIGRAALDGPASCRLDDVRLIAPIPQPGRFVMATGWNYLEHFEEGVGKRSDEHVELPEYPSFFCKADTSVTGPTEAIPYDAKLSAQFDSEAEIAVVIGVGGRSIPPEEASRHIFGYMLANDVTARDIQRRHGGQWFKGKSIDRSCPMGPWLTTPDEIERGTPLDLRCTVNDVELQDATTELMIFSIEELVSELSRALTLLPGDILLTGTPKGVGYARTPPQFLAPGDEVVVSSSQLGELRNRVVEQPLTTYAPGDGASP